MWIIKLWFRNTFHVHEWGEWAQVEVSLHKFGGTSIKASKQERYCATCKFRQLKDLECW